MSNRQWIIRFVLVVAAIAGVLMYYAPKLRESARSNTCSKTMGSICFAAAMWSRDNGDKFPATFNEMQNYVGNNTLFLICPSDTTRHAAPNFPSLNDATCSYEIVAPGLHASDTTTVYIRCKIHGHAGYADGTVFDGKLRQ
ncbi:MAG: hypothetical protein WCT04_01100 [Planctomycetota bacterium]